MKNAGFWLTIFSNLISFSFFNFLELLKLKFKISSVKKLKYQKLKCKWAFQKIMNEFLKNSKIFYIISVNFPVGFPSIIIDEF